MIIRLMVNILNTVKIGFGKNPLYNIRGPRGQPGLYFHEYLYPSMTEPLYASCVNLKGLQIYVIPLYQ